TKQEIEPRSLAAAKVVTDLTEQACVIGDLHHAIAAGIMSAHAVHAELGEVVAGRKPGRVSADEIIVFDSTGTGLQDVAAAIAVYRDRRGDVLKTGAGRIDDHQLRGPDEPRLPGGHALARPRARGLRRLASRRPCHA